MTPRESDGSVIVPAVGVAMTEARLTAWLRRPGDLVRAGDPVAEIETDKATMELEAPRDGRLGPHRYAVDDVIPIGEPIGRVLADGEAGGDQGADDAAEAIDIAGFEPAHLLLWLEQMLLIREFEDVLEPLAREGRIPWGAHSAVGQEAVAVGVILALAGDDVVASGHRPHHHALAKGMDPDVLMAELFGRTTGAAAGRGGTMHVADFERGYFGGNGIVGSGLGIAMGAALAAKLRGSGQVAVGFFGDGGANTGRVWECLNLAAAWQLPLVAVCENNLYAVGTHFRSVFAGESIAARAAGFGLPAVQVDGQDVCAVHRVAREAIERARRGKGPSFVEALTYRYWGHMSGEVIEYRTAEEVDDWRARRDPIARLAAALAHVELDPLRKAAAARVDAAIEFAERSPRPNPRDALGDVLSEPLERRAEATWRTS
jgi:TPP-dependent pyruvate/acetoin dehydrogenase alpha subunit